MDRGETKFGQENLNRRLTQVTEKTPPSFDEIIRTVDAMIWVCDLDARYQWSNQRWLDFTGHTIQSADGAGRDAFVHPADLEAVTAAYQSATQLSDVCHTEYRLRHASGDYRWVMERAAPWRDSDGELVGYIGTSFDIAHEYNVRRRLGDRERVARLMHEQRNEENVHLTHAIHSGLLQDIIGVDMLLGGLASLSPEDQTAHIDIARESLAAAIRHGRRVIGGLRPMVHEGCGLVQAIKVYVSELETRSGLRVVVTNHTDSPMEFPMWADNVFRMVQAALDNVELHSQTKQAEVMLSAKAAELTAIVRDDGIGFDVDAVVDRFGLDSILRRAQILGGTASIQSTRGGGTTVELVVPTPIPLN